MGLWMWLTEDHQEDLDEVHPHGPIVDHLGLQFWLTSNQEVCNACKLCCGRIQPLFCKSIFISGNISTCIIYKWTKKIERDMKSTYQQAFQALHNYHLAWRKASQNLTMSKLFTKYHSTWIHSCRCSRKASWHVIFWGFSNYSNKLKFLYAVVTQIQRILNKRKKWTGSQEMQLNALDR